MAMKDEPVKLTLKQLNIRDIKNYLELKQCVMMRDEWKEDQFFPADSNYALRNIYEMIITGSLFKVIEKNNEIIAWGLASIMKPCLHSRLKAVTQYYYHCHISGISAVYALLLFHDSMKEYAKANKITRCISNSRLENYKVFNRILEKDGWHRDGTSMVYVLDY